MRFALLLALVAVAIPAKAAQNLSKAEDFHLVVRGEEAQKVRLALAMTQMPTTSFVVVKCFGNDVPNLFCGLRFMQAEHLSIRTENVLDDRQNTIPGLVRVTIKVEGPTNLNFYHQLSEMGSSLAKATDTDDARSLSLALGAVEIQASQPYRDHGGSEINPDGATASIIFQGQKSQSENHLAVSP